MPSCKSGNIVCDWRRGRSGTVKTHINFLAQIMAEKIITKIIGYDLDYLIRFQENVIKTCTTEGFDPNMLSAMQDIKNILEGIKECGLITELPATKGVSYLKMKTNSEM